MTLSTPQRAAIYARVSTLDQGTGEPARRAPTVRRRTGLDRGRVRRSRRVWESGPSTSLGCRSHGCEAAAVRCPGVLAAGSPGPQPQAPGHPARRAPGLGRGVRQLAGRHRRHHPGRASCKCISSPRSPSSSGRASRSGWRPDWLGPGRTAGSSAGPRRSCLNACSRRYGGFQYARRPVGSACLGRPLTAGCREERYPSGEEAPQSWIAPTVSCSSP